MMMSSRKIAIIGGGAGMLAVLYRLYERCAFNTHIEIFAPNSRGLGEAYKFSPDTLLTNTRNDCLRSFNSILEFKDWATSFLGTYDPTAFSPRWVYGAYLTMIRARLIEHLQHADCTFTFHPAKAQLRADGSIESQGVTHDGFSAIFVSIGNGSSFDFTKLMHRLEHEPHGGRIRIAGSGLTGIDAILMSNTYRPDLAIEVHSRNGRFPAVRGDFGGKGTSIFDVAPHVLERPCFFALLRAAKEACTERDDYRMLTDRSITLPDELAYVQARTPAWQPLLYRASSKYSQFFRGLPDRQRRFVQERRSAILNRRVMFPQHNAQRLVGLMASGQLSLRRRTLDQHNKADHVDCTNDYSALASFLSRARLDAMFEQHASESAIETLASNGVYLLGPLLNHFHFFTEATSITVVQASAAVDDAISKKRIRLTQFPLSVRRKADQVHGIQDKRI